MNSNTTLYFARDPDLANISVFIKLQRGLRRGGNMLTAAPGMPTMGDICRKIEKALAASATVPPRGLRQHVDVGVVRSNECREHSDEPSVGGEADDHVSDTNIYNAEQKS